MSENNEDQVADRTQEEEEEEGVAQIPAWVRYLPTGVLHPKKNEQNIPEMKVSMYRMNAFY
jgi:hypothetical protein